MENIKLLYKFLSAVPTFMVSMTFVIVAYISCIFSLKCGDIIASCGFKTTGKFIRGGCFTLTCIGIAVLLVVCLAYYSNRGFQDIYFIIYFFGLGLLISFLEVFIRELISLKNKKINKKDYE